MANNFARKITKGSIGGAFFGVAASAPTYFVAKALNALVGTTIVPEAGLALWVLAFGWLGGLMYELGKEDK